MNSDPAIFAITSTLPLGKQVAAHAGVQLSKHEEQEFEDGEHNLRPLESGRGRDVYVIQSLYPDDQLSVNDKLVRLLVLLGAIRDAGARRLTAVVPYLAYSRKDVPSQPRGPVAARYVAQILEAVGTGSVPPVRLPPELVERKVTVLSCAPLLAAAIMRLSGTGTR